MPKPSQFVGHWVHWDETLRVEQTLTVDGQFDGFCFDEEQQETICRGSGRWEIVDSAILWHYLAMENLPLPKKPEVNAIVAVDKNRFDVRETSRRISDWYRATESATTSTNLDLDQVQPLLEQIGRAVTSGFATAEIDALMKKLKRLKPDKTYQVVFAITIEDVTAPFRIRVFMDDVDAPDIDLYGPKKLIRIAEKAIAKLDR